VIQQSWSKLAAGIAAAWLLGGVLEELVARGIVLNSVAALLNPWLGQPLAAAIAIGLAAIGAGLLHFYQGPRAVLIITQLSVLLGVLFVVSGYNLWSVIICHGLYDTIAFIRFAAKKSKYSRI
jgi:membrane protease YdiL (CAAX protease family)